MTPVARRVFRYGLAGVALLAAAGAGWAAGRLGLGRVADPASLPDVERAFTERMRDVVLIGSFTDVPGGERTPRPDRYEIDSVEKVGDDLWRFNARMECCGIGGATLPIVVPMRWLGDTPMITMTDASLPGLGRFTVRLIFYADSYAGMWGRANEVDGLMSGRIEKRAASPAP